MKNKMVCIGILSMKTCYLNISKEEAIARYMQEENDGYFTDEEVGTYTREFEFDDQFSAYDAWAKV